ncbi:CDP-alcohol phosphatidyltransferase family protein [Mesorhizobium sp. RP14(2022)]|uniref:CDP-alcohol phosphatidyltransferase family protein n=1 Tax=Mesorhizobium liriopis TaxID=2953882 RepID=A0ABT1C8M7_9HYPH|nr:CDP-alcohol phosphatidyltransferase family protein [Mesorhizobium liriopis]
MTETIEDWLQTDAASARFFLGFFLFLILGFASAVFAKKRERPAKVQAAAVPSQPRRGLHHVAGDWLRACTRWVARQNITPNQITLIGLVLVAVNCVAYVWHRDPMLFGASLIAAYLFDMLDGVVARTQGSASKFGGYLDAVVDRYQEVVTFLVVGLVTELWLPSFLVITGSMMVSYNKARAAIEVPVDNKGWPDLMGKGARQFFLCASLILTPSLPWLLPFTLWSMVFLTYFTALQRIFRAYFLIREEEAKGPLAQG